MLRTSSLSVAGLPVYRLRIQLRRTVSEISQRVFWLIQRTLVRVYSQVNRSVTSIVD
jgi:hypothetical protein